jgi:hypothetical protein
LEQGWRAEPHPYLQVGKRARVVRGPLAGMEGIVLRRKNRSRLVLSFELIQRSMAIEMDEEDLAAEQTSGPRAVLRGPVEEAEPPHAPAVDARHQGMQSRRKVEG